MPAPGHGGSLDQSSSGCALMDLQTEPGAWIRITSGEHIGRKARVVGLGRGSVQAVIRWGMSSKDRMTEIALRPDEFRVLPKRGE